MSEMLRDTCHCPPVIIYLCLYSTPVQPTHVNPSKLKENAYIYMFLVGVRYQQPGYEDIHTEAGLPANHAGVYLLVLCWVYLGSRVCHSRQLIQVGEIVYLSAGLMNREGGTRACTNQAKLPATLLHFGT